MTQVLSFANNWTCRTPRITSQESSVLDLWVKEAKRKKIGQSDAITKDNFSIPKLQNGQQEILPPLVSALKTSAEENAASFHFPGHNRGRAAPSSFTQLIGTKPFRHDLPELPELDDLFSPKGPIRDAQYAASKLFGSLETWFLVGGSTCGIQAAVMATCSPGDFLILPRNCHISVISAMVLSGALPRYIIPEYDCNWHIAGGITASQVDEAIKELEMEGRKASAVLITSPTYHGICSDLKRICQLCHSQNIPVIVDEAHGAHLGFHPQLPRSAMQQGADLAVQSTHKVLCSLTQSSMLHMSGNLVDRERICRCLQTLQSTSPSYILLASLDAARAQLSENPDIFNKAIELAVKSKDRIKEIRGISILDLPSFSSFHAIDPLRLTVGVWKLGISGYAADDIICRNQGVISELVETRSVTFAINLGTCEEHIERLLSGMAQISEASRIIHDTEEKEDDSKCAPFSDIRIRLSPREAFFAKKRRVNIEESVGEICGEMISPYPPGIPVMIPGEVITKDSLNYLLHVSRIGASISGASDFRFLSILVCT